MRKLVPAEIATFTAGLVTDASPLTFPDNASLSEENFVLNQDGSRERRFGLNYEFGHVTRTTSQPNLSTADVGRSSFKWRNAGGDPEKSLLVMQVGRQLDIFDLDSTVVSAGHLFTKQMSSEATINFSYAEVDGKLVVASGSQDVLVITYNADSSFSEEVVRIKVRDLFGVEDRINGVDLLNGGEVQTRPSSLTAAHAYNLRNQGWGVSRNNANTETLADPIAVFYAEDGRFPSNADSVAEGLYADPNDTDDRITLRFFPKEVSKNPIGNTASAKGHYVIDLFDRGASRESEYANSYSRHPSLQYGLVSLQEDASAGGVSVVTEFAGRAWFSGFNGEVSGADGRSPRLSSYLAFSRLAESTADIGSCYQEADPTGVDTNQLVDTDGGLIRIDGAFGIKGLVNVGAKLIILASNGVWKLEGGSDYGFAATAYKVSRVSEHGCRGSNSIVVVENTVMFWGDDGIYHITANQFGDDVVESLTHNRIQKLYESISINSKNICSGHYDTYEKKVRWVYNTSTNSSEDTFELVLDLNLKAFYLNRIKDVEGLVNKPILVVEGNSYVQDTEEEGVTVGGTEVVAAGDKVVLTLSSRKTVTRELLYATVVGVSPFISYTFSTYRDSSFIDWQSSDGVGVDAGAFLITGYISGGDFLRDKSLRYLQCYFERSETILEAGDDPTLLNESSCKVQAQWDWTNDPIAGKWSTEREFYRPRRHFMTEDTYNSGESVVRCKDKVRGFGKVLSLKFSSSPGKNLKLLGWSMVMSVESQ